FIEVPVVTGGCYGEDNRRSWGQYDCPARVDPRSMRSFEPRTPGLPPSNSAASRVHDEQQQEEMLWLPEVTSDPSIRFTQSSWPFRCPCSWVRSSVISPIDRTIWCSGSTSLHG